MADQAKQCVLACLEHTQHPFPRPPPPHRDPWYPGDDEDVYFPYFPPYDPRRPDQLPWGPMPSPPPPPPVGPTPPPITPTPVEPVEPVEPVKPTPVEPVKPTPVEPAPVEPPAKKFCTSTDTFPKQSDCSQGYVYTQLPLMGGRDSVPMCVQPVTDAGNDSWKPEDRNPVDLPHCKGVAESDTIHFSPDNVFWLDSRCVTAATPRGCSGSGWNPFTRQCSTLPEYSECTKIYNNVDWEAITATKAL